MEPVHRIFILVLFWIPFSAESVALAQTRPLITLPQCLKAAQTRHPSVRAFEKMKAEKAAKRARLKAQELPQIDYSFSAGAFRYSPYRYRTLQNTIELRWNLGTWLARLEDLGVAEETAARLEAKQNQLKLAFEVKQAFYQLVQARKALRVARLARRYLQRHVDISKRLFRLGRIDQLDLFRSETQLSKAAENAAAANNRCQQEQIQLHNLTGLPISPNDSLVVPEDEEIPPMSTDSLVALAARYNPALQILDQEIRHASLEAKLVRASRLPVFTLSGGFTFDNDPTAGGNYAVIQGGLRLPLVDWQQRKNQEQEFRLRATSLQAVRKALLLDIRTQIEKLLSRLRYLKTTESLKVATLTQAKRAYFLTEKTYRSGTASNTDVLLTQKEWTQAKLAREAVRLQIRLTQAELDFWIGKTGVSQ